MVDSTKIKIFLLPLTSFSAEFWLTIAATPLVLKKTPLLLQWCTGLFSTVDLTCAIEFKPSVNPVQHFNFSAPPGGYVDRFSSDFHNF